MSLMMSILADKRLKKEEVFATLEEFGMDTSTFEPNGRGGMYGVFPLDDDYVADVIYYEEEGFYKTDGAKDFLQADLGITWQVHSEIYFDFRLTAHCNEILANFVEALAKRTKANLNYSFQRESTYAVKDENGLRWLEAARPIRTPTPASEKPTQSEQKTQSKGLLSKICNSFKKD